MTDYIPTVEEIMTKVEAFSGVPVKVMKSRGYLSKRAIDARRLAMYLSRKLTFLSDRQISQHFNVDHACVGHAEKKMVAWSREDPELMKQIATLIDDIENARQTNGQAVG